MKSPLALYDGTRGDFIFPPKSPMPQIGPKLQYNGGKWRQTTGISHGASSKFVSRRKCIMRRLLAILRFAHDRPMLQIGPNLRSCGGKSLPRMHAATNREFDDDACCLAALWLPYRGLEGGLLSRYLRIMATNDDMRPPSGSHIGGLEGGLLSRYLRIMATNEDAWPPSGSHIGAGGRPFVPDMRRLWRRPWRATCILYLRRPISTSASIR